MYQAKIADSRRLAAQSPTLQSPHTQLLVAVESMRQTKNPTSEAKAALITALRRFGGIPLSGNCNGYAFMVRISPNGRWVAAAMNDASVLVWDILNPDVLPISLVASDYQQNVVYGNPLIRSIEFTTNSRFLVAGHGNDSVNMTDDMTAQVWDLNSLDGLPKLIIDHSGPVSSIACTSNNMIITASPGDTRIHLCKLTDTQVDQPIPHSLYGHTNGITCLALSHDEQWLVSGSRDKTAKVWHLHDSQSEPITLEGHDQYINTVAFSNDGQWIATAGGDDGKTSDFQIRLWPFSSNGVTGTPKPILLMGHKEQVNDLVFSLDGRFLVSASDDRTVRLWDLSKIHDQVDPVSTLLVGHTDEVNSLAIIQTPSRQKLDGIDESLMLLASASSDHTCCIWDLTSIRGEVPATLEPSTVLIGHHGAIYDVQFDPKGRFLITSGDREVRKWSTDFEQDQLSQRFKEKFPVEDVRFAGGDEWLVTQGEHTESHLSTCSVRQCSSAGDAFIVKNERYKCASVSPNGQWVIAPESTGDYPRANLWRLTREAPQKLVLDYDDFWFSGNASFSINSLLFTGSFSENSALWNLSTLDGKLQPVPLSILKSSDSSGGFFSPQGKWFLMMDTSCTGFNSSSQRPSFTSEQVLLWKIKEDEDLRQFDFSVLLPKTKDDLHPGFLYFEFSSDDHWLVVVDSEKKVFRLDLTTDNPLSSAVLLGRYSKIRSYLDTVNPIVFSKDNNWLAFTTNHYTVRTVCLDDHPPAPIDFVVSNLEDEHRREIRRVFLRRIARTVSFRIITD